MLEVQQRAAAAEEQLESATQQARDSQLRLDAESLGRSHAEVRSPYLLPCLLYTSPSPRD